MDLSWARQNKSISVNLIYDQVQHEARCDSCNEKQLLFASVSHTDVLIRHRIACETSNETFVSVPSFFFFCQNIPKPWHNIQHNFCQGNLIMKQWHSGGQKHYTFTLRAEGDGDTTSSCRTVFHWQSSKVVTLMKIQQWWMRDCSLKSTLATFMLFLRKHLWKLTNKTCSPTRKSHGIC